MSEQGPQGGSGDSAERDAAPAATSGPGVGLDGQLSAEGGIRVADAAVSAVDLGVAPGAESGDESGGGAGGDDPLGDLHALDPGTARILVGFARAMYPHDRLPDVHYERVVAALDGKAAEDPRMRTLLTDGVGFLATTTGRRPEEFAGLDEATQVAALGRLQETPFFQAVAAEVVVNLYSQPDAWPYFGYEGPSTDRGGYLHRGFDDIDWLDDAPDRRDAPVAERVGLEERIATQEA